MGKNRQNSGLDRSCEQPRQVSRSEQLNAFEIAFLILCAVIFIVANVWAYLTRTVQHNEEAIAVVQTVSDEGEEYDISVLNSATYDDFVAVKGIGDAKATAILNYRELLGGFTKPEQLMDVSGMGEKLYAEIMRHFYNTEDSQGE